MSEKYNVYFRGEISDGQDGSEVRERLAALFKADTDTLDRLFSGRPQLIKKACNRDTAERFKAALEQAGAIPIIKKLDSEPADQPGSSAPSLAAVGSELLREEEKTPVAEANIDTSGISLATLGEALGSPAAAAPAPPDTSHLSAEPIGDGIPNLPGPEPVDVADISGVELCPEGTDLSDCAPAPPPDVEPDLSHLDVAETGSDLLRPEERPAEEKAVTPDTNHLTLEN